MLKKLFSTTVGKILAVLSVPVIIIIIFAVLSNVYQIDKYKQLFEEVYNG